MTATTTSAATVDLADALPVRPIRRERLWTWMLLPGTAWMAVFFVSALLLLIALSFGTTDTLGNPRFGTTLDNIIGVFNPTYLRVIARSLGYAVAASVICLLIAYPTAYAIARHGGRYKNALVALLVVPFFANYLVRMYGWQTLLSDEGVLMTWLRQVGVPASFQILDTAGAVIGGLVYGYVVFMILPIYASLERMDDALIEAGRDLYGSPWKTFMTVTVPASRSGAFAGLALVFLPAMGDFISAQLLGGPDNLMIGNLIQEKFFAGQNWPLGSALTMALMVLLLICMFAYLRQTARDAKEARQ
ncbi:ABC transporter permease [Mycolicibacterium komossense]|uniref:ABC transporter permease n=1 Tax=Mycolicibacterium komossense TaxID=1779 RepID=A0ABT3C769_9MYCO|nr:ABC transporter permease [Mycolicibacterium komossense]MCV7225327.1 ABC transporter permease [Mycolicibacterium komossense]